MKKFLNRVFQMVVIVAILFGSMSITPRQVVAAENESKSVVFLINKNYRNAMIPQYYAAFSEDSNVYVIFGEELQTILNSKLNQQKISTATHVVIVGFTDMNESNELLFDVCDEDAEITFFINTVYGMGYWEWPHQNVQVITELWGKMYYSGIVKDIKSLNITKYPVKPAPLAGFGIAIYLHLQYDTDQDVTYQEYASRLNSEMKAAINEKIYDKCMIVLDEEYGVYPKYNASCVKKLSELPAIQESYSIHEYDVFQQTCTIDFGIFNLDRRYDNQAITAYDNIYLSDTDRIYSYNAKKRKWQILNKGETDETGLKVIQWDKDHFTTKVYRFQDKYLRKHACRSIQRDSQGNWYVDIEVNKKFYIYQLNRQLQVMARVEVSKFIDGIYNGFIVEQPGQVILQSYHAMDEADRSAHFETVERFYNPLCLINLKKKSIVKTFQNGQYIYDNPKIKNQKLYCIDASGANIVRMDKKTGKIEKVFAIDSISKLIDEHEYSDAIGKSYCFDYAVYGSKIYLLKHNGIYCIDQKTGECQKIVDGEDDMFTTQDLVYTDIEAVNDKELYVLGVYTDDEAAHSLFKITLQ